MLSRYIHAICGLLVAFAISAQPTDTDQFSFDPNPQHEFLFDKATNIWAMDNHLFVVDGIINEYDRRTQLIFKIDATTKQIVKQIEMTGPHHDFAIGEKGGYCLTTDGYILFSGEWFDTSAWQMRTFLAKLNKDLDVLWINWFQNLTSTGRGHYGDGVVEASDGNYMMYLSENVVKAPIQNVLHIFKTDTAGILIFDKILPDTFATNSCYGHISNTDDGHIFLASLVWDPYYHWLSKNVLLYKIDNDADTIWTALVGYDKTQRQEPSSVSLPAGGGAVMWMKDTFLTTWGTTAQDFILLYGYDSTGHEIWTHEFNKYGLRVANRIISAKNGDIIGTGAELYLGNAKGKAWLWRVNPAGELLWERHYSDSILRPWSPVMELLDVCEMADGRIAATGIVYDTNSVAGSLNPNIVVLIVDENGCLEPGCSEEVQFFTGALEPLFKLPDLPLIDCFPNPGDAEVRLNLPELASRKQGPKELRCFDMKGELVNRLPIENSPSTTQLDVSSWPTGNYQLVLFELNRPVASGKLIVHH